MEPLLDSFERRRMVKCLLCIYVFVVHIQADCPRPQGTVNIVLNNDALLKNDFPERSNATFECANGYVIETGSGVITCTSGQWTESDLKCKKKDCGPPTQQPNMAFDMPDGTLLGASVKVNCDKGYDVIGTSYKQCLAVGWVGRAKCEVIICDKPMDVAHGRHSWTRDEEPKYGDVIQYSCDDGYTLFGQSFITCSDDAEYDFPTPQCRDNIESSTKDITTTSMMSTAQPTFAGGKDLTKGTTTTETSVTPTIHEDKTTTTTAISTTSPSVQGDKHILTTDVIMTTTTTGVTSATPTQGRVLPKQDGRYTVVIASVISTIVVVLILLYIIHRCVLKKIGSYDTGEDLKPELLQFQSL